LEYLGIDSTPVIANSNSQITVAIFKFEVDPRGPGMTKCVYEGLPTNSVDLLLNERRYRQLRAADVDPKVDVMFIRELVLNAGQSDSQIHRARIGRPEALNGASTLLNP
jgi:hypothetical protein